MLECSVDQSLEKTCSFFKHSLPMVFSFIWFKWFTPLVPPTTSTTPLHPTKKKLPLSKQGISQWPILTKHLFFFLELKLWFGFEKKNKISLFKSHVWNSIRKDSLIISFVCFWLSFWTMWVIWGITATVILVMDCTWLENKKTSLFPYTGHKMSKMELGGRWRH